MFDLQSINTEYSSLCKTVFLASCNSTFKHQMLWQNNIGNSVLLSPPLFCELLETFHLISLKSFEGPSKNVMFYGLQVDAFHFTLCFLVWRSMYMSIQFQWPVHFLHMFILLLGPMGGFSPWVLEGQQPSGPPALLQLVCMWIQLRVKPL